MLSVTEKTKIILKRKGLTVGDLAAILNVSRQNLSNKFSRNNLTENDIKAIANALNCNVDFVFTDKSTGETV